MLNQLCIQAHSSSLRCGGSLCKVQHDKPARFCKVRHGSRAFAFTLAEVLITLTIIGVIAAITIPNLMKNYQTHIFKTAYKQAYSDINQAFAQAFKDGELIRRQLNQADATIQEFDILKQNLKVSKECTWGALYSCWAQGDTICGGTCAGEGYDENGQEIFADGAPRKNGSKSFIDSSGRSWALANQQQAFMLVDTNGFKGPNKFGQDRFMFYPYSAKNAITSDYKTNPPVRYGPYRNYNITIKNAFCKFPPCYYYDWLYK